MMKGKKYCLLIMVNLTILYIKLCLKGSLSMLVCMTKDFARLYKKAHIGEKKLNDAIREICAGNAISLGHKVFKKRIGSRFGGKRGGFRSILFWQIDKAIVFMYLYAKNKRDDITEREKKAFIELAMIFEKMNIEKIKQAITQGRLIRWDYAD